MTMDGLMKKAGARKEGAMIRGSLVWWVVKMLKWTLLIALVLLGLEVAYILVGGHGLIWMHLLEAL